MNDHDPILDALLQDMHRVHRARSRRRVALAALPLLVLVGVLAITLPSAPTPQTPQHPIANDTSDTTDPSPTPAHAHAGTQPQPTLRTVFIASDPTILDRLRAPSTPSLTIRADTSTTLASIDDDQLLEILRDSGVAAGLAYTEDGVKLAYATYNDHSIINTPDAETPSPTNESTQ